MRALAALSLLLALAGCWTGGAFYTAANFRPAVAAGDYATTSVTPDGNGHVRVTPRADGLTLFTPISADGTPDAGDAIVFGFAQLPGEPRLYAAWLTEAGGSVLPGDTVTYGLLAPGEGGGFTLTVPACTGAEAGATAMRDGQTTICHFAERTALEAALRGLGEGGIVIRLTPLPARGP